MKRIAKTVLLLAVGALTGVLGFLAFALSQAKPITHGLSPSDYDDSERAAAQPESVVVRTSEATRPPNIIVILADDLGYGDVGAYGGRTIETPNIDELARGGLRFTQAYSSAAVCSPSRAGLLTGRYPLRSGITTALQMAGDSLARKASYRAGIAFSSLASVDVLGGSSAVLGLPSSEITIPEALNVAGYTSIAIGKWHLGDFTEWLEYHPMNQGFDEFVGFNGSNDDFPVAFWRGKQEVAADIGADQAKYTGIFTDEAVGFIERHKEAPFFLYLSHKDPHLPFFPSEAFAGKSSGGPYGDAVSELDASVGAVIDALKANALEENTLVIVTSDNGPWFDGSPGGFRGRKGQSYEGGFRVPLIAWWPGQIDAERTSDVPVMNIDLLPTFLSLAGLSLPNDRIIDGIDLSRIFGVVDERKADPATDERALYFFHDYDVEGIRKGSWKFYDSVSHYTWPVPLDDPASFFGKLGGARDYYPKDGGDPIPTLGVWPNLYDLDLDPGEAYDVAKTRTDAADSLGEELRAWREAFYENPRGWK